MNTGIFNPFVRWWTSFSIMFVAMTTTLLAGMASFIVYSDQSYLSWLTIAIWYAASFHLGYKVYHAREKTDFTLTTYFTEVCTSLGLLGTIIGLVMMVVGAFDKIDVTNQESLRVALSTMSLGMGTALVTTLVGLVCALLLQLQVVIIREKWGK